MISGRWWVGAKTHDLRSGEYAGYLESDSVRRDHHGAGDNGLYGGGVSDIQGKDGRVEVRIVVQDGCFKHEVYDGLW
jgi:hypothetical protein